MSNIVPTSPFVFEEERLSPRLESSCGVEQIDDAVGSARWRKDIEGPFRRLDPNPDTFELVRWVLCAVTIVPIRVILIAILMPTYYVLARCFLALAPDKPWAHSVNIYCIRAACWLLLAFMGFWKVDVKGREKNAGRRGDPRVFVSNHVSYVEILYFLAELGPSFVMKRTCLRVPFIGSIAARILDSVSVDNKGGKEGGSGSQAISARLVRMFGETATLQGVPEGTCIDSLLTADERWQRGWRGNPLLLFPEGTTSNGSCLMRFKTGVFAGGVPVYPVTVQYDHRRFSPAFESIYFPVHTFRMLAEPVNHLRVEYLPRYCPTPEQRADRGLYAKAVQQIFCEALGLPAADAGYAEKTRYHIHLREQFRAHPWGAAAVVLPAPDHHVALKSRKEEFVGARVESDVGRYMKGEGEGEAVASPGTEISSDDSVSSQASSDLDAAAGGSESGAGLRRRK